MKRTLSLLLLLGAVISSMAAPISEHQARSIAAKFFGGSVAQPTAVRHAPANTSATALYIYNAPEEGKGFIVISGDDATGPVLGYSHEGKINADEMPDGLQALLDLYAETTAHVTATPGTPVIQPLLQDIEWGQNAPFNSLTPKNTPTGCVAAAATQIMRFYQYPAQGTGQHSYQTGGNTLSADFGATAYDWANMPAQVPEAPTAAQTLAYSTLASHFGIAVDMEYNTAGSGALSQLVPAALTHYFGYSKATRLHPREYYSSTEWMDLIRTELNAGRPVYYGASSDTGQGGHAFVVDGYDTEDYLHVNWGWYGTSNGYFLVNHLNPSDLGTGANGGGYNRQQEIITGIEPANGDAVEPAAVYGGVRLSVNFFGTDISLMTYLENVASYEYNGELSAVLVADGEIVKTLKTMSATVPGFEGGRPGSLLFSMTMVPVDASGVTDGNYRLCLALKDEASGGLRILRHPIGLPAYADATVAGGVITAVNIHTPTPDVTLTRPITTDGELYQNGSALFSMRILNRAADCRINRITLRFTSVEDTARYIDIERNIDIYDLSEEDIELITNLPEELTEGDYELTAFANGNENCLFDDEAVGRTRLTILPEATTPVLRMVGSPVITGGEHQGDNFYVAAAFRNYGKEGTGRVVLRMENNVCNYVLIEKQADFSKGGTASLVFGRQLPVDAGSYALRFYISNDEGQETLIPADTLTVDVAPQEAPVMEVQEVDVPEVMAPGERYACSMKVKGLATTRATVYLRLRQYTFMAGELIYMKTVNLVEGEEQTFTFNYKPALSTGSYMTSVDVKVGSETFMPTGFENAYHLVEIADASGIAAPENISAQEPLSVYTLSGVLVVKNAPAKDAMRGLKAGIYVVKQGGKAQKVTIRP